MSDHLRRYAAGALAVSALAGVTAVGVFRGALDWRPVSYGLTASPAELLPADVTTANPVRIVGTTLDPQGRPVVSVHTATNKATAAAYISSAQRARNAIGVETDAVTTAAGVLDGSDPMRGDQWHLARIKAADAWATSTGNGVTVAVLDTGVDASHPDLAGRLLPGYDAIHKTADDGTDANGHGTQVAGVIAALTGNDTGVSGIAPDAQILPVRVLNSLGLGYASDTATGIVYAADHGAKVIDLSLTTPTKVAAVSNAIAYARGLGAVVVAAGGNDRLKGNPASYPAADGGVIAVAATDANDKIATYSTKGGYIDVAAPGNSILSTFKGGDYRAMTGTSAAAPQVAAVAALVKAARPALTPDQVEWVIEKSASDLGVAGKDADFGFGMVNALAAVGAVNGTITSPAASPSPSAPPAKAPVKAPAKIKLTIATVAPKPVVYGGTATVKYTVLAAGKPWALHTAQLGIAPAGSAVFTYTDVTTDGSGAIVYALPATGKFQIKLVVPTSDTYVGVSSPVTSVVVQASADVSSWDTGLFTVDLAGAVGQTVRIQRLDPKKGWLNDSTYAATSPDFEKTGLVSGTKYRIIVPNTTAVTGLTSAAVTIA